VDRRWRWAALVLGLGVLSIGCNPAIMSYFLLMGKDDKSEPDCQLAVKGKDVKGSPRP
jgi:hypothetical protein